MKMPNEVMKTCVYILYALYIKHEIKCLLNIQLMLLFLFVKNETNHNQKELKYMTNVRCLAIIHRDKL